MRVAVVAVAVALTVAAVSAAQTELDVSGAHLEAALQPFDTSLGAFRAWQAKHADFLSETLSREYALKGEHEYRYTVWKNNLARAHELNLYSIEHCAAYDVCHDTAVFGPTQFSDMLEEEWTAFFGLRDQDTATAPESEMYQLYEDGVRDIPSEFDWTHDEHHVVTRVHNQGQCGSCWAFSAVASIESVWAVNERQFDREVQHLSEGQIVHCDTDGEDQGCHGGYMWLAMDYVAKAGGLENANDYPYHTYGKCQFDASKVVAKISGHAMLPQDANEIAVALYNSGVVSVGLDATPLMHYDRGIVHGPCSAKRINHGVAAQGYHDSYWKIKNSWGSGWGERGYFRIARGHDTCGVESVASIAKL